MPARKGLKRVLDDGGDRLVTLDQRPLAFDLIIFVAVRELQTPITIEAACPHPGAGLLGILATMFASEGRLDNFKDIVFGIVGKHTLGRFQFAACCGDRIADSEVGSYAAC
ncbi:hypothetical protein AAJ72_08425 [Citromicrobium sp. RCC1885]|nr:MULTISPECIES: hypothetical protein [unclassified Citromicrobium]KPM25640.1 hypothetical protein AAJ72_08425 [Citromicrobium sp. RCC1885]KPM28882.1 hypothetical protein AAJ74_09165 [Citromicrobium sp. RCC1878]OAM09566.1 hypothetical protein A0U43_00265 [Citromicrobium sp. RCC1897]